MSKYINQIEILKRRGVRVRHLRTFAELDSVCNDFLHGSETGHHIEFLLLVGQMGTGKSWRFKNEPGIKYINTAASAMGLYVAAWNAKPIDPDYIIQRQVFDRDSSPQHYTVEEAARNPNTTSEDDTPVVMDDIDGMLNDKKAIPFFKSFCQKGVKQLTQEKMSSQLVGLGIPNSFLTSSRCCLIFNELPEPKDKNLGAVFDRARVCFFDPTVDEVHKSVGKWWSKAHPKDMDVYKWVGDNLKRIFEPSIRIYEDLLEDKLLGHDWKAAAFDMLRDLNYGKFIIGEMASEPWFESATTEQKKQEYMKRSGRGESTWKLDWKEFKEAQGIPDAKRGRKAKPKA